VAAFVDVSAAASALGERYALAAAIEGEATASVTETVARRLFLDDFRCDCPGDFGGDWADFPATLSGGTGALPPSRGAAIFVGTRLVAMCRRRLCIVPLAMVLLLPRGRRHAGHLPGHRQVHLQVHMPQFGVTGRHPR